MSLPVFGNEHSARQALIVIALSALVLGLIAHVTGRPVTARWTWGAGTLPVLAALALSILRDFRAGRMGVDAVAFVSMTAALGLGETLAGVVVAVMYAGGNVLEDFAVSRAERDLKALVDRAPTIAHRRRDTAIEDVAIDDVVPGDVLLVRGGEVIPIDGIVAGREEQRAIIDEAALTGEPMPVTRRGGEAVHSGTVNAGDTFELQATASAGDSTYAGIVRLVTAAQTAKAPFIRLADRYALLLLPVTLLLAGAAWLLSGDPIRGLAVLVAATPCPLILAAPVAFIAGVSRAARHGILIKSGGALEALARTHTVIFDKTGTLTVGGARLVAIEAAPGQHSDDILRLAASLEQASRHVVASAIVGLARAKGLKLELPSEVRESFGSGLEGLVGGKRVKVGSHQLVTGSRQPEEWARRALRRAGWRSALSVFVSVDGQTIGASCAARLHARSRPCAPRASGE
jgi:cation transport ATPase